MWVLHGMKLESSVQKTVAADTTIALTMKELFKRKGSLLETNQGYIKPIII